MFKFSHPLNLIANKSEKILAMNWGKTFLTVIYVLKDLNNIKLLAYDVFKSPHPPGTQTNQEAVLFIKKFLKQHHIHEKKVILTISNPEEWITKYVVLPPLPPKEVLNAIKWNLQDDLKIDLDKVSIKWSIIKEFTDDEGNPKLGQLVMGISHENLSHYNNLLNQCNLMPVKITDRMINYSDCLLNLSNQIPVVAVLSMGFQDTLLGFYVNQKLFYLRAIPTSLEKIVQVITDRLSLGQDKKEQHFNNIKNILSDHGILQDQDADVVVEGHSVKSFSPLMRPYLELLVRELKLSIDYFKSTFEGQTPQKLYITGFGGGIKNLDQYLNRELKLSIEALPVPPGLNVSEIIDETNNITIQHQLLNTLCSTFSDRPVFNFSSFKKYFLILDVLKRIPLPILTFVFLLITVFLWITPFFHIQKLKLNIQSSNDTLNQMQDLKGINDQINVREEFIKEILSNQVPAVEVLRSISVYFPNVAILDNLDFDQSNYNLVLKGHFELNNTSVQTSLLEFIKNLESTKLFSEVNLTSVNKSALAKEFEIRCVFPNE